jgi:hypothetical protein
VCLWDAGFTRYVGRRAGAKCHWRRDTTQGKNITLPPVPPPVANYVDSVQVGKLLYLAGNTAGAEWKLKGKVGKDITVQEGYDTARQVGLIMLAKALRSSRAGCRDRKKN